MSSIGYEVGGQVRFELFREGGESLGIVEETVTHVEPIWPTAFESNRDDPRWKDCHSYREIGPVAMGDR